MPIVKAGTAELRRVLADARVVPAVRRHNHVSRALASRPPFVILLTPSLETLPEIAVHASELGVRLLIHADMIEGIASDAVGLRFLARLGVTGIATTRAHTMGLARQAGLMVTFRAFLIDSGALATVEHIVQKNRPDIVELLPAPILAHLPPGYIDTLGVPALGGGLIQTQADVEATLAAGATAVSTSTESLWP